MKFIIPYRLLLTILVLMNGMSCGRSGEKEDAIRRAVSLELSYHPEATLQDVYKNFFQNAFGPGHMIPDTSAARAYLEFELAKMEVADTVSWQPLGADHLYYRVNLSLVKHGRIPKQELLEAFTESANTSMPPALEEWRRVWDEIVGVISTMETRPGNFDTDRKMIEQMLNTGEYAVHHSRLYHELYHPHYRIVSREAFDRLREKYLN